MKHFNIQYKKGEKGITLLITLLLMGVLLGVSASLLNITLKQYQLAGISLSSEVAFQTANAGLECMLYHDFPETGDSPFEVNGDYTTVGEESDIRCFNGIGSADIEDSNDGVVESGDEQRFQYTWGTAPNSVCSDISIYKFYEVPSYDGDTVGPNVIIGSRDFRDGSPCPEGSVCTVVQARGYNVACANISTDPRVVEREYTLVY